MKLLIMCEGQNELELIRILLENNLLKFTEDDLLGLSPYHARQIISSAQVRTQLNMYPGEVEVLRIGDKQKDNLVIPPEYEEKIKSIKKYCTKPELEMLLILAEGLEQKFDKVKSSTKHSLKDILVLENIDMTTVRNSIENILETIQIN